jgi:hypothetical protein
MKNTPCYFFLLFFLIVLQSSFAQQSYDLEVGKPMTYNGIEYGFEIRNERKKDVKEESFNRFEITVFVTNRSGCTKLMFPRRTTFGYEDQNLLANFDCLNATGKRLTSKSGTVRASEFTAPYNTTTKDAAGKNVTSTVSVKVGHVIRNGETRTDNFIVIVPDGEQPRMKVRVITLPD